MNRYSLCQLTCLLALSALLGACGGSSSSSSSSGGTVDTRLFYTSDDGNPVSLYAVDPDDPDNPVEVADNLADNPGTAPLALAGGSYGQTVTGAHQSRVVFNSDDGGLYQVDTTAGSEPEPERFSGETSATDAQLCDMQLEPDYADPDHSLVFYSLDQGDGCAWHMAILEDDEKLAPLAVPEPPVAVLRAPQNGAIEALLFHDSTQGALKRLSLEKLRLELLEEELSSADLASASRAGRVLLRVYDVVAGQTGFRLYDHREASLEEVAFSGALSYSITDPGPFIDGQFHFLAYDIMSLGYELARVDPGAENPEVETLDSPYQTTPSAARIVASGRSHVAWRYNDMVSTSFNTYLRSVSLDDGYGQNLASGNIVRTGKASSREAPSGWLFYRYQPSCTSPCTIPATIEAVDIRGSGHGAISVDAAQEWTGKTWSREIPEAGRRAERVIHHDGDHLISRAADDPRAATEITLGELPDDWEGGSVQSFTSHALLGMEKEAYSSGDVLLVDPQDEFSLERITDDDSTSRPVPGF